MSDPQSKHDLEKQTNYYNETFVCEGCEETFPDKELRIRKYLRKELSICPSCDEDECKWVEDHTDEIVD